MDQEYFLSSLGMTPETTQEYPHDPRKAINCWQTNEFTDCTVVGFVIRTLDPNKRIPDDLRVTMKVGNSLAIDYNDATLYNLNLDLKANTNQLLKNWEDWTLGIIPQFYPVGARVLCEFYTEHVAVPSMIPSLIVLKEYPSIELVIKPGDGCYIGERLQRLGNQRRLIVQAKCPTEESCRELLSRT